MHPCTGRAAAPADPPLSHCFIRRPGSAAGASRPGPEVEEVVVTHYGIRNSAFAQNYPVASTFNLRGLGEYSTFSVRDGVSNLFDIRPQSFAIIGGFESRRSVPWGRQVWVSLDWAPGA